MRRTLSFLAALWIVLPAAAAPDRWIDAANDGRSFVLAPSNEPFVPWGFNYDRDHQFRLIEEYWHTEWNKVESDFREMKRLGANVVRVHLQFAKFMDGPAKPNAANMAQLDRLLRLAEETGIYLDLTGLGTYRPKDVPEWYDASSEKDRWAAQERFWEAVAAAAAPHRSLFCYNLMNEPIVAGEKRTPGSWTHPGALEGLHYMEFISLDLAGRSRSEVARAWIRQLTQAIRRHDKRHMVTVGLALIDIGKPERATGFPPGEVSSGLSFVSVHLYPRKGQLDAAIETLTRCSVGKPVLIEETFPLRCDLREFREFLERTRPIAAGWVGFYWGRPAPDAAGPARLADKIMRSAIEAFQTLRSP